MAELSPAAQAVLDAFLEISPAPADEIAAVALRVAADQLTFEDSLAGAVVNPRELLDIAEELKNWRTND